MLLCMVHAAEGERPDGLATRYVFLAMSSGRSNTQNTFGEILHQIINLVRQHIKGGLPPDDQEPYNALTCVHIWQKQLGLDQRDPQEPFHQLFVILL